MAYSRTNHTSLKIVQCDAIQYNILYISLCLRSSLDLCWLDFDVMDRSWRLKRFELFACMSIILKAKKSTCLSCVQRFESHFYFD
jgi:hypothetical protein